MFCTEHTTTNILPYIISNTVMLIVRQFDEEGVKLRRRNRLRRRVYLSKVIMNNTEYNINLIATLTVTPK